MKKLVIFLALPFLLATCVREVDFQQNPDDSVLVVDAVLTDGPGPHRVTLTRLANYFDRGFETVQGATISLQDSEGNSWNYNQVNPPNNQVYYELTGMTALIGHTYTLNIRLADGTRYQSSAETMPDKVKLGGLEVFGEKVVYNSLDGVLENQKVAALYATAAPTTEQTTGYLYWEMDDVYIFRQLGFFGTAGDVCYVEDRFNKNNLPLYDLSRNTPGAPFRLRVGQRLFDESFYFRNSLNVYQRSVTATTYKYLQAAQSLINQTGTVLDPQPATPHGNISNLDHPDHPALGIFSVAAADTLRVFVNNGDLGADFSQPYYYCTLYPNSKSCSDCLVIPRSTHDRPFWWVD